MRAVEKSEQTQLQFLHYRDVFQALMKVHLVLNNYCEVEKILERLQVLLKSANDPSFAAQFVATTNSFFARLVLGKTESGAEAAGGLLSSMHEPQLSLEQNTSKIHDFIMSFLLLIVHRLPAPDDLKYGQQFRTKALREIKKIKKSNCVYDKLKELLSEQKQRENWEPDVQEVVHNEHDHFYSKIVNPPKEFIDERGVLQQQPLDLRQPRAQAEPAAPPGASSKQKRALQSSGLAPKD